MGEALNSDNSLLDTVTVSQKDALPWGVKAVKRTKGMVRGRRNLHAITVI